MKHGRNWMEWDEVLEEFLQLDQMPKVLGGLHAGTVDVHAVERRDAGNGAAASDGRWMAVVPHVSWCLG